MPTQEQWRDLLRRLSEAVIDSVEAEHLNLPEAAIRARWLGFPGASEAQIASAEARLGKALPPSYREFLKVSNGFPYPTKFIDRLWSAAEIDWFAARNQDWIDAWDEGAAHSGEAPPVTDGRGPQKSGGFLGTPEAYFVYGEHQDAVRTFRPEYLKTALEISDMGDSAIMLLNPQVVTPDGEWEAWFFANWIPGAERYRSFWEMMNAQYTSFLDLERRERIPYRPGKEPPQAVASKLDGLIGEIEEKASLLYANVDTSGLNPGGYYASGQLQALQQTAHTLRVIQSEGHGPEALIEELKSFVGELEEEAAQSQTPRMDTRSVFELAQDFEKANEVILKAGWAVGCQMAAGMIRWFLGEHA